MQFKFTGFKAAGSGKVTAELTSDRWEPPAKLTFTTSVINDLVVGAKIGDTVEITINRR